MNAGLLDGASPDIIGICRQSDWIQSELFIKLLKYFGSLVKPFKEGLIMMVLDGHSSRARYLD
ncbi:hypothetical protein GWI33_010364, partial [Rhynchophorus ferrugineus]